MVSPPPVSSSRRSVVELLAGLAGLAFFGPEVSACRRAVPAGPALRLRQGTVTLVDPKEQPPTLWLALAALPPGRRSNFLDDLEASLASAEARRNPLMIDVVDDDPKDVIRRARPWLLPLCTAAHALLSPCHASPDGLVVDVLPRNAPREPHDIAAWGAVFGNERTRRARFLAWAVSRALVVHVPDVAVARALDAELSAASIDASSAVGLVLTSGLLRGECPDRRLTEVLEALASALLHARGEPEPELSLSLPHRGADLGPWIVLSQDERLVVPKLSALSPSTRFESELTRRVARYRAQVVSRSA
jgi:hypothetical protein